MNIVLDAAGVLVFRFERVVCIKQELVFTYCFLLKYET